MMVRTFKVVLFVLVATLGFRTAAAQHAPADPGHAAASHPNHAALFAGFTVHDDAFFTLGGEYVRRLPDSQFGVGGWAELVFAGDVEFLLGVTGSYFLNRLVLETGPGFLVGHGTEFLWRIGAGYELEVPKWSVTPKAAIDFIAGETFFVFGVAVGKGF